MICTTARRSNRTSAYATSIISGRSRRSTALDAAAQRGPRCDRGEQRRQEVGRDARVVVQ
jgi:hypothetical protein